MRSASLSRLSRGPPPRSHSGGGAPAPSPFVPPLPAVAPFATLRAPVATLPSGRAVASGGVWRQNPASALRPSAGRSLRSLFGASPRHRPFFHLAPRPLASPRGCTLRYAPLSSLSLLSPAGAPRCGVATLARADTCAAALCTSLLTSASFVFDISNARREFLGGNTGNGNKKWRALPLHPQQHQTKCRKKSNDRHGDRPKNFLLVHVISNGATPPLVFWRG